MEFEFGPALGAALFVSCGHSVLEGLVEFAGVELVLVVVLYVADRVVVEEEHPVVRGQDDAKFVAVAEIAGELEKLVQRVEADERVALRYPDFCDGTQFHDGGAVGEVDAGDIHFGRGFGWREGERGGR